MRDVFEGHRSMPNVPARMTAIAIRAPGGPEMLVPEERPVPQPAQGEVLVKVAAAGVNRPDVMQRMGHYPPPKGATDIPGLNSPARSSRSGEACSAGRLVTR
jgi:threonine dehydrogenase-like Zn-dependent dehydrogenase